MFGRQSIDFGVDSVDGGSVGEIDGGAEIVRVVVLVFAPHDQFKVIGTAGFGGQGNCGKGKGKKEHNNNRQR